MHPKLIYLKNEKKQEKKSTKVKKPRIKSDNKLWRERFHGVCGHCQVRVTPLWRKVDNTVVCNACGIYFKTHGRLRKCVPTDKETHDTTKSLMLLANIAEHERMSQLGRQCIIYGLFRELTGQP